MSITGQVKDKIQSQYTILNIPVIVEKDNGYIIISDYEVNMYGIGKTLKEAEEDYKDTIKAYFEELEEEENNLGDNLKQHLHYLREKLEKELI